MTVLASASTSTSFSSSASSSAPQIVAKASESGSVLNGSLGDYAVLDSACSHRPVFKALALFDRAPVVDSPVQMIDSNGNTTTAAGIGSATLRLNTVNLVQWRLISVRRCTTRVPGQSSFRRQHHHGS
jgi:hypothetical protein